MAAPPPGSDNGPTPHPGPGRGFSRWPWWRRWFGRRSERAAARFLRKKGCRILAANVDDRLGELDLLALDGKTLVVVEVRSTESGDLQRAAESVDAAKQRRITEATLRFLAHRRLLDRIAVRFDVLAVSWPAGREPAFHHIPHAFEAVGRFQMYN